MKKIFNRTKRPQQEWRGYDDNEYDWDSAEQNGEDDAYYADGSDYYAEDGSVEDDGMYYAEDGFAEDDGMYYAEEGSAEDGGMYYVEDGSAEDDRAYYAEDGSGYYEEDGPAGEDEAYYAEEDGSIEDGGTYYAEDAAGYEDDYYGDEEADGRARSRTGGFWSDLGRNLAGMGIMDKVILGTGAAVLILALITGSLYISNLIVDNQISDFVNVGTQLDGIETIGEAGLLAVADAQMAKMSAASVIEGLDGNRGYDEQDYNREVQVGMELVSIQKDLKIKFINKDTGKLIANVPFAVKVTDPDGKDSIWSDDDMDGIVYKKDITPGSYKLAMEVPADEKYARFIISTATETTTVKKDIEYKKVNVDNEIKSEDEVDASKEDTKVNETKVESALQDTVAWVASTVTPSSYIEVPKSSITDPKNLVAQVLDKTFLRATETTPAPNPDESTSPSPETTPDSTEEPSESPSTDPSPEPSTDPSPETSTNPSPVKLDVTLANPTPSLSVGETVIFLAEAKANDKVITDVTFTVQSPSNGGCATVTVDNGKVTVRGDKEGNATYIIKATPNDTNQYSAGEATLTVKVTAARTISLDKKELTLLAGESATITATVSNAVSNTPDVKAESSNANVVKVVKCDKNVVTIEGIKADDQVVTVTVTYTEGNETISEKCLVKVKSNPEKDTTTKLKDSNGTQLYVKEGDKTYREAVYADYYKDVKLYIMGEAKYTGWQTIDGKVYFFTADGKKVTGEQVIQGAKYNFASDGSLVTGNGTLGIDVSKWNGTIDWNAVKNSGVNYVIIRCGYRGSTAGSLIEDPNFTANIKGATAAGLKVGVYFFTQAVDEREAVEEASMVLSQIKNYKISYPVFLDVESSGGRADSIDRATRTAVCKAFCQTIKNAGYNAGIYANKTWFETKINTSELSAYKIWLAQYASTPTYGSRYDLWQYRSTGRVSGISGDVDMNLSYLGY